MVCVLELRSDYSIHVIHSSPYPLPPLPTTVIYLLAFYIHTAPMMPDAEVLTVAVEILSSLPIGAFTIKLNHRGLLDGALALAGVPATKFRGVCSSIDKLDKESWEDVR